MTSPTNLLQLADEYAKAYFMGRGDDARKRFQAAVIVAETAAFEAEQKAVADEREACAALAKATCSHKTIFFENEFNTTALEIEKAIRARGNQPAELDSNNQSLRPQI